MLRNWVRRGVPVVLAAAIILPAQPSHAVTTPGEATASVAATALISTTKSSIGVVTIRVVAGDTLWDLAGRYCGRPTAYPLLAAASAIPDPDRIDIGQRITIRCVRSAAATASSPPASRPGSAWVAPVTGAIFVRGDCKVGGRGGHWLAQRPGHLHKGIDIGRAGGVAIRAVHSGRIVVSRWSTNRRGVGAGWYVMVDHANGYQSVAMHMRGRSPLAVGTWVRAGQVIGYVGATGARVTHLHFEIHHGRWHQVNPAPFLRSHGIRVGGC